MRLNRWLAVTAVALLASCPIARAAEETKKPIKDSSSFGALKATDTVEARKQLDAWVAAIGKSDAATQARLEAIWKGDHPLLDKVSSSIALYDTDAAKLLVEARDDSRAAPIEVPALLRDKTKSAFYRANLTLAYGKALTTRKVYEEGLEALALVRAEEAIDPSALFFHKAVCEYQLMLKDKAEMSIDRLLVDVNDSPERYRMVAALMHFDMLTWQEKDLGWIARKMSNIQRRLDLKRGGQKTQKEQKEVLVRLDEMIKELENKQKGDCNGGCCPGGGEGDNGPGSGTPSSPMKDSGPGTASGPGEVDLKRIKETADAWGKLPEKERAQAMKDLIRTLPAKDRQVIEAYLREIQKRSSK